MRKLLQTLRFRLTLWYSFALSLVLAVSGLAAYLMVRDQLLRHHDTSLSQAAAAVGRILSQEADCEHLTPTQHHLLERVGHLILFHEVGDERRVLYRSPDLADLDLPLAAASNPGYGADRGWFETISGPHRGILRMYSQPYRSRVGRRGVIHVVEGLGDIIAPLVSLRFTLLSMVPLAVILSALGGYWLAGRALAPVDRITRLAQEIGATSLSRRLPVPPARDEIGRLVGTFNQMIGRLEVSFETMKRFTADASHELRGPLATMRGAIDVALGKPRTAPEYQDALASLGEDVDRLRSIVDELLVLARADAGRLELQRAPVRLDVLASEIAESLQPAASGRGVTLQARCPSPAVIQGDERWLRQLLFNLVDNAIKFSVRPGVPGPHVVGVDVSADEGAVHVSISDSGPGIPEEVLDRIFERFYRADEARAYRGGGEGSGLGLSIAAWIAEAHGGRITARNRAGGGAAFLLTLPSNASEREREDDTESIGTDSSK